MLKTILLSGALSYVNAATNYCAVLDDDFNGPELDQKAWIREVKYAGGGNGDFEWYTDSANNSFTRDGNLYLMPTFTADNMGKEMYNPDGSLAHLPIQSASLKTSASIKYGKVEVRAKLPVGDWMWPAIWMLPKDNVYGGWPASGEIDIMENRGNAPGCTDAMASQNQCVVGRDTFGATLNWGTEPWQNRWYLSHTAYTNGKPLSDDYHIYGLLWSKTSMTIYLDDPSQPILTYSLTDFFKSGEFPAGSKNPWEGGSDAAPFDQEFYLILNIAVGGTNGYFQDNVPNKPWKNQSPTAVLDFWNGKDSTWGLTWPNDLSRGMAIDYVKMWKEC